MRISENGLIVTVKGESAELARQDGATVEARHILDAMRMLGKVGYTISVNAKWEEYADGSGTIHGVFLEGAGPKPGVGRSVTVKMKP